MIQILYIYMVICTSIQHAKAIIAYDCEQNTTLARSMPEFGSQHCKDPSQMINPLIDHITILHFHGRNVAKVRQCMIKTVTLKTGCGQNSHMYAMKDGFTVKTEQISRLLCNDMHDKKILNMDARKFNLRINDTTHHNYVKGSIDDHGNCHGTNIEQIVLEVTLRELWLEADPVRNVIFFPDGGTLDYAKSNHYDPVYGYSFWVKSGNTHCAKHHYTILYEGAAWKYYSDTLDSDVFYTSNSKVDFVIPMGKPTYYSACSGTIFHKTIYDKLLIVTNKKGLNYMRTHKNFRATEFVAAKAVRDVDFLYEKLKSQECLVKMHENLMSYMVTTGNSDEFAYYKMRAFGYTSDKCGGLINIKKCTSVDVKVRSTDECYDHVPIVYNKTNVFMTIRTHIIKKSASITNCYGGFAKHPRRRKYNRPRIYH